MGGNVGPQSNRSRPMEAGLRHEIKERLRGCKEPLNSFSDPPSEVRIR